MNSESLNNNRQEVGGNPFNNEKGGLRRSAMVMALTASILSAFAPKSEAAEDVFERGEITIEQVEKFQEKIIGLEYIFNDRDFTEVMARVNDAPTFDEEYMMRHGMVDKETLESEKASVVQIRKGVESDAFKLQTSFSVVSEEQQSDAWGNGFIMGDEDNTVLVTTEGVEDLVDNSSTKFVRGDMTAFKTSDFSKGDEQLAEKLTTIRTEWQEEYKDQKIHGKVAYIVSAEDRLGIATRGGVVWKTSDVFINSMLDLVNNLSAQQRDEFAQKLSGTYGIILEATDYNNDGIITVEDHSGVPGSPVFVAGEDGPRGMAAVYLPIKGNRIITFFYGPDTLGDMMEISKKM